MNIEKLLDDFKRGAITKEKMIDVLKNLPFCNIEFVKIDTHRKLRRGFPEVVFCENKTSFQIKKIIIEMNKYNSNILATRLTKEKYEEIKKDLPESTYNEAGQTLSIIKEDMKLKGNVLILTGGTSDIKVAEEAFETAKVMGCDVKRIYDVGVAGIHRLFAYKAQIDEADVIITVAGMEGALPSVVAGLIDKPVIAVPTSVGYGANFNGLAALLTMLNSCAPGIAVMNIDNGFGAAYFAATILRLKSL